MEISRLTTPLSARSRRLDLYTATRHYFGWYAWNVLELDPRDIALHFVGHRDGGELVRKLYGHPDAARARDRIREAYGRRRLRRGHSSWRPDPRRNRQNAERDEIDGEHTGVKHGPKAAGADR